LSSLKEWAGVKWGFGLWFYVVAGFFRAWWHGLTAAFS